MCQCCGGHGVKLKKDAIEVDGMSCDHCKSAVEKAVRPLPGILSAEVDLVTHLLKVEYDESKIDAAKIKKVVEDLGYDVK
jgi:copper ion binding protein